MLHLINNLPARLVGVHACADVTETEYEVMLVDLFNSQLKNKQKLNFLLVLESNIENFASGLWCGNLKVGIKYFFSWNKIAIVTDRMDVLGYSDLFRYILPGKFKTYKLTQLDEAIRWASLK